MNTKKSGAATKKSAAAQPVDTIRQAREHLEHLAEQANLLRPAPWTAGLYTVTSQRRDPYDSIDVASRLRPHTAAYVGLMDPEVGVAVAGLLELGEKAWDALERQNAASPKNPGKTRAMPSDFEVRILDLARLINERTS